MVGRQAKVFQSFLGANVRRWRRRRELTQENLIELTGMDIRFLQRIESGTINARLDTVVRLAQALDVEPSALLRRAKVVAPKSGRPRNRRAS